MDAVALVLWITTAAGGLTMGAIWLAGRGPAQHRAGISRLTPTRLGVHFGLAATGLVLWIVHVAADNGASGWVALVLLPFVALLGVLMLLTWLAGGGAVTASQRPAENHFPVALVAAHGLFAVLTVLAVVIALVA